ncbi:MAG: hypothetical protein LBL96_12085 [Clostridiales bacterium]|jgi:hypothetical protein|nr:hypothetical protein [Clostridiales bacterium]
MGEVFKEQLVKRQNTSQDTFKRVGIVIAALILVLVCSFVPLVQDFLLFVMFGAAFGAYALMSMLNLEYEYAFTSGELDIDVIYNKSRRKRVFSGLVKDFEVMAHVDDKQYAGEFHGATETKDYGSGKTSPNSYAFLTTYKGSRTKIIIEPNETMLKAFQTVLTPRKLHKKM